jgi:prophage tail gpP-like protein
MDCSSTRRRRPVRMALAELPLVANLNVASRSSNNGESVRDQRWPLYVDSGRRFRPKAIIVSITNDRADLRRKLSLSRCSLEVGSTFP